MTRDNVGIESEDVYMSRFTVEDTTYLYVWYIPGRLYSTLLPRYLAPDFVINSTQDDRCSQPCQPCLFSLVTCQPITIRDQRPYFCILTSFILLSQISCSPTPRYIMLQREPQPDCLCCSRTFMAAMMSWPRLRLASIAAASVKRYPVPVGRGSRAYKPGNANCTLYSFILLT